MIKFLLIFLINALYAFVGPSEPMLAEKRADLVVFSYNRPMQLYAFLKSVSLFMSNIHHTSVLYRTDVEFAEAYEEIKSFFPKIEFVKQGFNPRQDFKPLLLQCFMKTDAQYILFAVDDDLVKEPVNLSECMEAMERSGAYCFFLRLGENITRHYNADDVRLTPPPSIEEQEGILKYYMNNGCYGDWRYCNNVDMTLYKKKDIYSFFVSGVYTSPNTLESEWARGQNLHAHGLFFKRSKIFSLPINRVQTDFNNHYEGTFSASELLQMWQAGMEMDLAPYMYLDNSCAFVSLKPTFIPRKRCE